MELFFYTASNLFASEEGESGIHDGASILECVVKDGLHT
jgi:hypothetical protein